MTVYEQIRRDIGRLQDPKVAPSISSQTSPRPMFLVY